MAGALFWTGHTVAVLLVITLWGKFFVGEAHKWPHPQGVSQAGQRSKRGNYNHTRQYGRVIARTMKTHSDAEADEAPSGWCDNLQPSVGLDEAHKELAQLDMMPVQAHMQSQRRHIFHA